MGFPRVYGTTKLLEPETNFWAGLQKDGLVNFFILGWPGSEQGRSIFFGCKIFPLWWVTTV